MQAAEARSKALADSLAATQHEAEQQQQTIQHLGHQLSVESHVNTKMSAILDNARSDAHACAAHAAEPLADGL